MLVYIFFTLFVISFLLLVLTRWTGYRSLYNLAEGQKEFFENIEENGESGSDEIKLSVVVVSDNQGRTLEQNLPYVLEQNFEGFEVIVVDVASEDATSDAIKRLSQKYGNIRQTYVPKTSRNLNRLRLGYTLGIRAARSEWIVVTQPDCIPDSYDWLKNMFRFVDSDMDVVMGYANYNESEGEPGRRAVFERTKHFIRLAQAAIGGRAIGADGCNLLFRRKWFLDHDGFAETLGKPFGIFPLLVDRLAEEDRVATALYPDTFVHQSLPFIEDLKDERIFELETARNLRFRARLFAWRERLADNALVLFILSFIGYLAGRILTYAPIDDYVREVLRILPAYEPAYEWWWLAFDVPALIFLILSFIISVKVFNRLMQMVDEEPVGTYVWVFHFLQPWRSIVNRRRHRKQRKDFVSQTI